MYQLIRTQKEADAVSIDYNELLYCDTETCRDRGRTDLSADPGGLYGQIRLFQIYQATWKKALIFDCFFVDLVKLLEKIKDATHVYHNASYDLHTINCHTPEYYYPFDVLDTFYLAKAVFTESEKFDFYSCLKYAKLEDDFIRGIDKKENQKAKWHKELTETMLKYAASDVLYLSLLYPEVKDGMDELCKIDHYNLRYAVEYDRRGLPINRKAIRILKQEVLSKLEQHISQVPVNINSPKQCKEWLGTSNTNAATIGTLALKGNTDAHHLVEARKADKLLQFIEKYDNEWIKSFHNACGARTGRFTATGGDVIFAENNQNPPRKLYPCIQAKEGQAIVYNDYAALELRTAVAYVGETTMYDLMMTGRDLHTYTGCEIFNVSEEDLTAQQRWVTKIFTFSNIYGAGPVEMQNQLQAKGRIHMDIEEVEQIKSKWFSIYKLFQEWHKLHRKMIKVYGYIDTKTMGGRVVRAYRINESFNFPIQGSAAEVTKLAVHLLCSRYPQMPQIINVVHDSIALTSDLDDTELWVGRLNTCMIDAWYEVISSSAYPELVMPAEAAAHVVWPGIDESMESLVERGVWDGVLPPQIQKLQ